MFSLIALALIPISFTTAHIYVKNKNGNGSLYHFRSESASFNPEDVLELTGLLYMADPSSSCSPIRNLSEILLIPVFNASVANCTNFDGELTEETPILLTKRGHCSVALQAHNAHNAGFQAVIIFSDKDDMDYSFPHQHINSDSSHDNDFNLTTIPTVFLEYRSGRFLQTDFLYTSGHCITLTFPDQSALKQFLSTFLLACLGVLCFFGVLFFVVDCVEKTDNSKVTKSALKKIRTTTFDELDTDWPDHDCSICCNQYLTDDSLRVLPCQHRFHSMCVDPWLLKNAGICPLCRRNVLTTPLFKHQASGGTSSSDSADGMSSEIHRDNKNHDHESLV